RACEAAEVDEETARNEDTQRIADQNHQAALIQETRAKLQLQLDQAKQAPPFSQAKQVPPFSARLKALRRELLLAEAQLEKEINQPPNPPPADPFKKFVTAQMLTTIKTKAKNVTSEQTCHEKADKQCMEAWKRLKPNYDKAKKTERSMALAPLMDNMDTF